MFRSIALLFIAVSLYGANLIETQALATARGVTLQLRFDEPFEGSVIKRQSDEGTTLILEGVHLPASKSLEAGEVEIELVPQKNRSLIVIHTERTPLSIEARRDPEHKRLTIFLAYPRPASDTNSTLYLYWLAIFIFGLGTAWLLSRFLGAKESASDKEPTVLYEKPLDSLNRLALISYKGRNYLVILGQKVTLLESFGAGRNDKERFDEMVQKLTPTFEQKSEQEPPAPDPIEEYKKKASGGD